MKGWQQLDAPWYATEVAHCGLCGQMIAGRVWVVDERGEIRRFCGPECERTHATYWLPRYAKPAPTEPGPEPTDEPARA